MFKNARRLGTVVVMAAGAWMSVDPAQAQIFEPGSQAVNINARSDAVAARRPGNMVSAAMGRARDFQNRAFAGTQITETELDQPLSLRAQVRIEALQILFTNLNLMINVFHNQIRAQAGLEPIPPVIPDFSDVGGGDGFGDFGDLSDLLDDFFGNA